MGKLSKLAGDTAIYGGSSIVGRMLNYLLVPYYTSIFLPGEYGIVTELYAIAAFLNVMYLYGMETAYFRFASKHQENEPKVYRTAVSSLLLSSIFFSILLVVFASTLVEWMQYPGKEYFVYWFAAIISIDAVLAIPFARLRYLGKAKLFAGAKLFNIVLNISLNLFFLSFCRNVYEENSYGSLNDFVALVYNPDYGVEYVFIANLIANAALFPLLWSMLKGYRFIISKDILKPMLRYGYPLLFAGLAYAVNDMLSRVAIKYWLPDNFYEGKTSLEALGIYGAVYKLSIFMTLGIQAFRYAAEPFFFSNAEDKNSPQLFAKLMHWFIICGCFVFIAISLNLDILQYLLRSAVYREGIHVVPVLLMANLFLGIYYNLSIWYKLTDRTGYATWITIGGAMLTLVLNYVFIPIGGYEASALITLTVYVLTVVISYIIGQYYYPVPYKIYTGLIYLIISSIVVYFVYPITLGNQWLDSGLHLLIMGLFLLWVYFAERKDLKPSI
jgi:O-antigen/teichoic acid export membrane protein